MNPIDQIRKALESVRENGLMAAGDWSGAVTPRNIAALLASHDAAVQRAAEMERDRDEWKESVVDGNKRFQIAEQRAREMQERCAQAIDPKDRRPCDCDSCYCGNLGDAQAVADWDACKAAAACIRAIKE